MGGIFSRFVASTPRQEPPDPEAGLGTAFQEDNCSSDGAATIYDYPGMSFDMPNQYTEKKASSEDSFSALLLDVGSELNDAGDSQDSQDHGQYDVLGHPATEKRLDPPGASADTGGLIPPNAGWLTVTGRRPCMFSVKGESAGLPWACPYLFVQQEKAVGILHVNVLSSGSMTDFVTGFVFCDARVGEALRLLGEKEHTENPAHLSVSLPGVRVAVTGKTTPVASVYMDRYNDENPYSTTLLTDYIAIWPHRSAVPPSANRYEIENAVYRDTVATDDAVVVAAAGKSERGAVLLFLTPVVRARSRGFSSPAPFPFSFRASHWRFLPPITLEESSVVDVARIVPVHAWTRCPSQPGSHSGQSSLIRARGFVLLFLTHRGEHTVSCPRYFSAWVASNNEEALPLGIVDLNSDTGNPLRQIAHMVMDKETRMLFQASAFVSRKKETHPPPYCRLTATFWDPKQEGALRSIDAQSFEMGHTRIGCEPNTRRMARASPCQDEGSIYHTIAATGMCAAGAWDAQTSILPGSPEELRTIKVSLKTTDGDELPVYVLSLANTRVVGVDLHHSTERPGSLSFIIHSPHVRGGVVVSGLVLLVVDIPTKTAFAVSLLGTTPGADLVASLAHSGVTLVNSGCADDFALLAESARYVPHQPRQLQPLPRVIMFPSVETAPPPPGPAVTLGEETGESAVVFDDTDYSYADKDEIHEDIPSRSNSSCLNSEYEVAFVDEYEYEERVEDSGKKSDSGPSFSQPSSDSRLKPSPGMTPLSVLLFERQLAVVFPDFIMELLLTDPHTDTPPQFETKLHACKDVFCHTSTSGQPHILSANYYSDCFQGEPYAGTFGVYVSDGPAVVVGVAALPSPSE